MRRRLTRGWLAASLLGATLLGCQAIKGPHANQPLLLSKQPIEGRAGGVSTDAPLLASAEPKAPPMPTTAFASARPADLGPPTAAVPRPNDAVSAAPLTPPDNVAVNPQRRQPLMATPAVRSSILPAVPPAVQPVPVSQPTPTADIVGSPAMRPNPFGPTNVATPAAPVTVPGEPIRFQGTFGHDANYTTLQGTVDRHYHGHTYLRYSDPKTEDVWGGKVCLEDDPRLAPFKEGDVIRVEGGIIPEADENRHRGWNHYPRFRIKNVELIRSR